MSDISYFRVVDADAYQANENWELENYGELANPILVTDDFEGPPEDIGAYFDEALENRKSLTVKVVFTSNNEFTVEHIG